MSTIRKATRNDIEAVAELFDQYRVWYGKSSDLPAAKAFLAERLQQNESIILVADEQGTLT
jgi:hypothetical protein